jgi:hypothetical protein
MNHRTTTITLLVVIAVATLLAAGIVVAIVRSNHSAFAHKNYDKFSNEDKGGRDGDQYLKCIVVENGGITDNSCNNHDGATPTPTPTPIPTPCPAGTVVDLSLTAALGSGTPPFGLPSGTVLCLSATGGVLGELVPPKGELLPTPFPVALDGEPNPSCPAFGVVAVVASGTVPTALPTPIAIGQLGVCVFVGI